MTTKLPRPALLCGAYAEGYFPMPDAKTEEILWYRPDPRAILPLDKFHVSRSLKKKLSRDSFQVTYDKQFKAVMEGCAQREETWINLEFKTTYAELFELGVAHSVEIIQNESLVGGVYGLAIGGAFFAESMFHTVTDASKAALFFLVEQLKRKGFTLLEVQFLTSHLESLGAIEISDAHYQALLQKAVHLRCDF